MAKQVNYHIWENGELKPLDMNSEAGEKCVDKILTTLAELWYDQTGQTPTKITITKEIA